MLCPNCERETPENSNYCSICGTTLASNDNQHDLGAEVRATRGKVLAFDWKSASGVISGDDGKRYEFQTSEWTSKTIPRGGVTVDFIPDGNRAKGIYLASGAGATQHSAIESKRLNAGILGILVGFLGIHKFYLGYNQAGIVLLVLGTVGWLLVFPGLVAVVIGIVEGVIYLTKSEEEFNQIYVEEQRPWF